ncbi:MAG: TonB-dependent receptor [Rikenellaceae bacterium]|nr:TonB-dependent receptor [Rikenellaceae bacterium]
MKRFFTLLMVVLAGGVVAASAQNVGGVVRDQKGEPLVGASLYWEGTMIGTATDANGAYTIYRVKGHDRLVATYLGYADQVVEVPEGTTELDFTLVEGQSIDEVQIEGQLSGNFIKQSGIGKQEMISFAGLCKMACCNLAESFENSASVTVGYSDAVSGSRQIKMLGLAGTYTQILDENRPIMRGIGSPYGLNYTPGMWLNSIQVSKGIASVTAGHEAMTGQINLEYRKPTDEEKLFLNLYFDNELKPELNLAVPIALREDKSLTTNLLVHLSGDTQSMDHNGDGFRDLPQARQINVANRWLYQTADGSQWRWGWRYVDEGRVGGQMEYTPERYDQMVSEKQLYGSEIYNKGLNAYLKVGKPIGAAVWDEENEEEKRSSLAFVMDMDNFAMDSYFGLNTYSGVEQSVWGNLSYQHYFSGRSSMVAGGSIWVRHVEEDVLQAALPLQSYIDVIEPGVFAEYTYTVKDKFSLVAGIRGDLSTIPGGVTEGGELVPTESEFLLTPRMHLRYNLTDETVLRASAGLGSRRVMTFTDNIWMLGTNRRIVNDLAPADAIEKAATLGGSLTHSLSVVGYNDLTLSFDYFHTRFMNAVLADQETADGTIHIYSVDGKSMPSYAHNYQFDVQWNPAEGLDIFTTFRYTDSKITKEWQGERYTVDRPLVGLFKGLVNVQYATKFRRWVFDFTAQLNGPMRLPSLDGDITNAEYSPIYPMFYGQVSHRVGQWDIYVGCENIANFFQKNPIIAADAPFSPDFNSSVVWGPLMGRKFYIGARFNLY